MANIVPEGWSEGLIGDAIISAEGGVSVNSENRTANSKEYGVLKTSSVVDGKFISIENKAILPSESNLARINPQKDHILFSRMNTPLLVGQSSYVNKDYKMLFLPDRLWQLRINKNFSAKWLSYSLRSDFVVRSIFDAATGTSGSMKNISKPNLMGIPLLYPPLPEQQKIATILSSVDDVIEKTRAQIDKLKDLKTSMMQELLTEGIGHTEFKDSPVGWIPKTWEVKTLGDLIKSMDGGVSVNGENREKGLNEIGVLKVSSVFKGQFLPQEHKAVVPEDVSRVRLNPKKDHILFSRANTPLLVGESAYIDKGHNDLFLPDKLWMIDVRNRTQINVKWLSYILCSGQVRAAITDAATGSSSTMKNISKPSLLSIQTAVPPILEQQKIVHTLQSIDTKIMTTNQKLISVEQTKKALMQDLLTGKVRVEHAEK